MLRDFVLKFIYNATIATLQGGGGLIENTSIFRE